MNCKLLHSLIFALFLIGAASAQDYPIVYSGGPYQPQTPSLAPGTCPPEPAPLDSVTDSLSDYVVGQKAVHRIGFMYPDLNGKPWGLAKGRQVVVTFPDLFILSSIAAVSVRDTDPDLEPPPVESVFVYSHTVVIRFVENLSDYPQGTFFFISLDRVSSPTIAGDYAVSVSLENRHGQTVAGPAQSGSFRILSGQPNAMRISPSADTTIHAGQGILFEAIVTDRYGNRVEGVVVRWSLDPVYDSIGALFGSLLYATKTGAGKVVARAEPLEATSGLITVLPGEAAALVMTADADTASAGVPLAYDIALQINDRFGNRKTDYVGAPWFASDDSLAEIVHNETNPYRFTRQDAGRKVFGGEQFVFNTQGSRTLTATDGVLAARLRIQVSSPAGAGFSLTVPAKVVAGEPFDVSIDSAQDSYGRPFTGVITVSGGITAPDGTPPALADVDVGNGQGMAPMVLYAAGVNQLLFQLGAVVKPAEIKVTPAVLGAIALDVDETQFLGTPFVGTARVKVYDIFGNPKTDFSSSGISLRLSADSGQIVPGILTADRFDATGTASLAAFAYTGRPGPATISVTAVDYQPPVESRTGVMVNGIYIRAADLDRIPPMMLSEWSFEIIPMVWNPANLFPSAVSYQAGFSDGSQPPTEVRWQEGCLPQPFNAGGCRVRIVQAAGQATGIYDFVVSITATYEYAGDSITATWSSSRQIDIRPFTAFGIEPGTLPDTGFAAEYSLPISLDLSNDNDLSQPIRLMVELLLSAKDEYSLGLDVFEFDWAAHRSITIDAAFTPDLAAGEYEYLTRIAGQILFDGGKSRIDYRQDNFLGERIQIVPRAELAVDTLSITPKVVPVGTSVSFGFDLVLSGTTEISLDGAACSLSVTDGTISATVRLKDDHYTIRSGANHLAADKIIVPRNWEGKRLTGIVHLVGVEAGLFPVDQRLEFVMPVKIESMAAIQVLSLTNAALNSPFVNIGQTFAIKAEIASRSSSDLEGPFIVALVSDGPSTLPPAAVVARISAFDTVEVALVVIAAANASPAEIFTLRVSTPDGIEIMAPIDDNALALVQTPARLELIAQIPGKAGPAPVLAYGETFSLIASFINRGQAQVDGGKLVLNYVGQGDFGVVFPSERPLDSQVTWSMTAPSFEISSEFGIDWADIPRDRNTGEPAIIVGDGITVPFAVRLPETRLVMEAGSFDTRPLVRGVSSRLFELTVENITNDSRNIVALRSISLELAGRNGEVVEAGDVIADTGTNFYIGGAAATAAEFDGPRLVLSFTDGVVQPGQKLRMEFRLMPRNQIAIDYFIMRLNGDLVDARIAGGPQMGQRVIVTGTMDRAFEINIPQSIIPEEFAASFRNYPNPFDPNREATDIRYNLPFDSDVDIYIYTMSGERVRQMHFNAGANGGRAGLNAGIYWDGRNGSGDIVLNGVYVAYIRAAVNDLTATLKVAVVK